MKCLRNNVVAGMLVCLTVAFMSVNLAEADDLLMTITTTADYDALSYVEGESYTFSVSFSGDYIGSDSDIFYGFSNKWFVDSNTDPVLIASISGDGLSGTYQRPSNPSNYLYTSGTESTIWVDVWDTDDASIGLTVDGNDVVEFEFNCSLVGQVYFYCPEVFTNPVIYFQDYLGTYDVSEAVTHLGIGYGGTWCDFTMTELTISTVPEPATMLLLAAGGLALLRRRNKK